MSTEQRVSLTPWTGRTRSCLPWFRFAGAAALPLDRTCSSPFLAKMRPFAERIWSKVASIHESDWSESPETQISIGPGSSARIGDVVGHTLHGLSLARHEAILVAPGVAVGFSTLNAHCTCAKMTPRGSHPRDGAGCMRLQFFDTGTGLDRRGRRWRTFEPLAAARPMASRRERVFRALSSVGSYVYDLYTWNCQHMTTAICRAEYLDARAGLASNLCQNLVTRSTSMRAGLVAVGIISILVFVVMHCLNACGRTQGTRRDRVYTPTVSPSTDTSTSSGRRRGIPNES